MSVAEKVEADLIAALKAHDDNLVSCLRLIKNALKNKAKDLRRTLNAEEEAQVLKTLAKQRREAMEQFSAGGRQELADKEAAELKVVETYLPPQIGEDQIRSVLDEVLAELQPQGPKDMGKVMKAAMARLGANADGKLVNSLVRQKLGA